MRTEKTCYCEFIIPDGKTDSNVAKCFPCGTKKFKECFALNYLQLIQDIASHKTFITQIYYLQDLAVYAMSLC